MYLVKLATNSYNRSTDMHRRSMNRHKRLALLAGVCCSVAFSAAIHAEGAVRRLQCSTERVCDAAGSCVSETGEATFLIEPVEVDAAGAGRYTISFAQAQAPMLAQSELGPFLWTLGTQRHALIISSETQWLWHTLDTAPVAAASIRFMQCRLTN